MIAEKEHLENDIFLATVSIEYRGEMVSGDLVLDMDPATNALTGPNFYLLRVGEEPFIILPEDLPDSVKPKLALLKLQGRI